MIKVLVHDSNGELMFEVEELSQFDAFTAALSRSVEKFPFSYRTFSFSVSK